jgi:hypothetical protein
MTVCVLNFTFSGRGADSVTVKVQSITLHTTILLLLLLMMMLLLMLLMLLMLRFWQAQ